MKNGIRIITNTTCNKRCCFCYQKNHNIGMNFHKLKSVIDNIEYTPAYITIMGGEFFICKEWYKFLKYINKKYPSVKEKNITTNGSYFMKMLIAKLLGFHLTVSGKKHILSNRINLYYDNGKSIDINAMCKTTLCMDLLKKNNKAPIINNVTPIKISEGHYKYNNYVHIFTGENMYGNDELIILPNGKIVESFCEVLEYEN